MTLYPYLLAVHVSAMAIFVGGLLFQSRLISIVERESQTHQSNLLVTLFRLDRQLLTPALGLTWIAGLSLTVWAGWLPSAWLVIKIALVIALSALHGVQSGRLRRKIHDAQPATGVTIKGSGAGIMVCLLAIAILVLAKPI